MRSINVKVHPLVLAAALAVAVPAIAIAAGTVLTPPVTSTGASSTPILTATNNGAGPGLQGVSAKGTGVIGQTKFNSTSSTNGQAGVLGQDLSTSGTFDAGVRGSSNNGTGVYGYSKDGTGLSASSGNGSGLVATGATGVYASGTTYGVYASGISGIGASSSGAAAVEAQNGSSTTGFYANGISGGDLFYGETSCDCGGVFRVDDSGNVYAASFNATLSPNVIQPTSSGGAVNTYTNQTTSPTVEDAGEGVMVAGTATVKFDSSFSQVIDKTPNYSVDITPEGDNRGLFVARKSPLGFAVMEGQGGHATLKFSYRVVARPLGNRGQRLANVVLPPATKLPKRAPQFSPSH